MKPVKFGIIGCGVIGTVHLKSVHEVANVDVADVRAEVVWETARTYQVEAAYTDADELLADSNVEAVVLARPAHVRTELALRALQRGKHVLTEKPVAMNAEEVRRMMAAQGRL